MLSQTWSRRWNQLCLVAFALCFLVDFSSSVKHENFKTCDQSGFCKRNREHADAVHRHGSSFKSPYKLDAKSLVREQGLVSGVVLKDNGTPVPVQLPVVLTFSKSGTFRIQIDEAKRKAKAVEYRQKSDARIERYNEAANYALVGQPLLGEIDLKPSSDGQSTTVTYGSTFQAIIYHDPFRIDFLRDNEIHVRLNAEGLLNVEEFRPKIEKPARPEPKEGEEPQPISGPDESSWWEETFGGNTDSKPRGPESIGLDIVFPGYANVYGVPGHAGPLSLRETRGASGGYDQPYRLYNSDVFEYEINSPMTLYGAVPFMQAHRKDSTVGVFWLNAAETWIDIVKSRQITNPATMGYGMGLDTNTHWFSESGILDLFVFLGPTPKDVIESYSELTGTTALPQEFATAYHQCRWNYVSDDDVKDVDRKFDRANIPYDIIWLDIEYADGKKYFTWDKDSFPDPIGMGEQLDSHDRKLVAIIDPHIKNEGGYNVVDEMKSKNLAVNNKDNSLYEGWCWPGSSHWIDCFNPAAIKWWQGLFTYKSFFGTMKNTFIWNDMNEPSVFNGPETTMPKDNLHHGNWEHRDVHNIYGMTFHNATYQAMLSRDSPSKRPFVLTRSYFAGSQRLGAMWTGDNQASWDHLQASFPMVLSQNIAGFGFAGADVGGFFGNPSKELLTRWYQAGTFYPFFRGHAHIDTRRREPYMIGQPYTEIITQALRLRYALLPTWYTAFHEASVSGVPIVRPNYYVHPGDEQGFAVDDQLYIGSSGLLAKPVVHEGAEHVDVYIADDETYYDYFDFTAISGKGKTHKIEAKLEKIPLLMQGGYIFPRRDRPRRSSGLMKYDPYTLVVVLDRQGNAEGALYVDDGESFEYEEGAYIWRNFTLDGAKGTLRSVDVGTKGKKTAAYLKKMDGVKIERVVVVAAPSAWAKKTNVKVTQDGKSLSASLSWNKAKGNKAAWAVVRNPGLKIGKDFAISFA